MSQLVLRKTRIPARCVFCLKIIKQGQPAFDRSNGIKEHVYCYEMERSYKGVPGVLERSKEGEPRCHECGWYCVFLARHVLLAHGMSADEYREKWKLNANTALCSYEYSNFHAAIALDNQDSGKFPSGEEGKKFLPHPSMRKGVKWSLEWEIRHTEAMRIAIGGDNNPARRPEVKEKNRLANARALSHKEKSEKLI